jgi:Fur family zinc uptake transcriptional regulator
MGRQSEQTQSRILEILRQNDGPLSANGVLEIMRIDNPKTAPPTIYRALGALTDKGLVHRLETLNAYLACRHGKHSHASILSICDVCGGVEECLAPEVLGALSGVSRQSGFVATRHVIEMRGQCADCGTEGVTET